MKLVNVATMEQREKIRKDILTLKEETGLTYSGLNAAIGRPCSTSTLQRRAIHHKKPLSLVFYNKILKAIEDYKAGPRKKDNIELAVEMAMKNITDAAQVEINRLEHMLREAQREISKYKKDLN